jgi:hypothetical protein
VGPEQWCSDCAAAYRLDVGSHAFPLWEQLTALGIVLGAGLLSVIVAVLAGRPVLGALVGSTLLASLCILLVVVGRRFWLKRTFVQKRGHVPVSDEPALPLGLTMPPEPAIAVRDEPPLAIRPTVRAMPADLPALFSMVPTDGEPPPPSSVAVAPPPPSIAAPAPVPPEASAPSERFSSPAPAHALVATQSDTAPREAIPTVPSRRRATPFAHAPSFAPSGEAPPRAHAVTMPGAHADSMLPDATGWRPVERTEPASPRSKSPSEIQRLADTLPSLPPAPEVPVIEEPPPSVAVAARPATLPCPPPEVAVTAPTASLPNAAPVESEAPAPASTPEPSSDRVPESALPYAEDSGVFAAAACHPVDRSRLVACRPVSARPTAYACSRMQ